VLFDTGFGRVWRWHLLIAGLLVLACAVRQARPAYRAALGALLLASLGLVGHAVAEQGWVGLSHEINASVHLLAVGLWLGGLVNLGAVVVQARRSASAAWYAVLRHALPRFSRVAYGAVALVALTGVINTVFLVGSIDGLIGTPYGRLLLVKISLFFLLLAVAVINRLIVAPWIHRETAPSSGTAALLWTVGIEQTLGLGILAVVSVLGTWPPAIHMLDHSGGHHH
jgi:putative copper resistance protein D